MFIYVWLRTFPPGGGNGNKEDDEDERPEVQHNREEINNVVGLKVAIFIVNTRVLLGGQRSHFFFRKGDFLLAERNVKKQDKMQM